MPGSYAHIIERLKTGESVKFRPTGNSMSGKIDSGSLVTLAPVTPDTGLTHGDAVLCKVRGRIFVHLITGVKGSGDSVEFQISNNHGHVNGWTGRKNIFGIVVGIEP